MSQTLTRNPSGTVGDTAGTLTAVAAQLVAACPAPALLLGDDGQLRLANPAAVDLLRLDARAGGAGAPIREVLGVGWRELLVISRAGDSDLVVDLPPTPDGRRRGTRVRIEPVAAGGGPPVAIVAFLETPSRRGNGSPRGEGTSCFDAIFGHDPALVAAKEAAARFARTLLPVLLLAETGTGKELLARALHEASPRHDQPFVAINCGALSPHLLESELFGYAP
ncbi:MAG: sigma 54-interacting transcriptional regulator, partial [Acidobacteria bacterium]|nr:sigma 54-interacting transcriptional regulator [Acidobacteriota bacterium]